LPRGQGRLTFGEWRQMLSQARGSLYEVKGQVITSPNGPRNSGGTSHDELTGLIEWVKRREAEAKDKKPQTTDN
jgi:hypothetical protein